MSLVFNDTSVAKGGLIQECESIVFGDNSYGRISNDTSLLSTFTRYINEALNRVITLIITADGRWQFDDNNNLDYPIATYNLGTTLGSEQQDYTFDISFLRILRVDIQDNNGSWHKLDPIDEADVYDRGLTDFMNQPGLPIYYDPQATSIFLYPKPLATAVTSIGGLKVWFQRPPSYFLTTDTAKVPGINSLYHRLIALIASRDYAAFKGLSVVNTLNELVMQQEDSLGENYALRNQDDHARLTGKKYNWT